jgi:hypothetical protein
MCCGEEGAQATGIRPSEERGALDIDLVHNDAKIVLQNLERRGVSLGENRSERPVPRRSMRVSRENEARRRRNRVYGGYSQARSRLLKNPETNATSMDRPPRPDGRERYRRFL